MQRFTLLGVAAFATMAALRVCDPLVPALAVDFAATKGEAGQTVSAFAVAYGIALLLYGPLGDRKDKFAVISLATLACTVGCVACALASSLQALVLFRAGWGLAAAGVTPLAMAWIGDTVPYERRQEALSRLIGATTLGLIAGQWVGGIFADVLGWRSAFWALAVVFAATGALMCAQTQWRPAIQRPSRAPGAATHRAGVLTAFHRLGGDPWTRRVLVFSFLEGTFVFGGLAFLPTHLHERFGLPMRWAGAVLAVYGLGGVIYSRLAPGLLRRFGQSGLARLGGGLMCVYFAVLSVMNVWWLAAPACLAGGLGFYMLHSTLQTHATQMAPDVRGTAVTTFSACLFMGNSLGVALAARIVDWSSAVPVFMLSAVALPVLAWRFAAHAQALHGTTRGAVASPPSAGGLIDRGGPT